MRDNGQIMDYLEKLKSEQNLSISEIARRVGMAKSGVSRYFNRTREFPINKVEKFAEAFHVTVEDILGINNNKEDDMDARLFELMHKLDAKSKEEVIEFAQFKLFEQNND